jgi:3-hydroxyacyl-[acyl-carrier-protein] dehydratase
MGAADDAAGNRAPVKYTVSFDIETTHPAFAGHFPGQPLLPGVSLLAETLEAVMGEPSLRELVGSAPRIGSAKFLSPVRPGAHLILQLDATERGVRFEIREAERIVASGHFEAAA